MLEVTLVARSWPVHHTVQTLALKHLVLGSRTVYFPPPQTQALADSSPGGFLGNLMSVDPEHFAHNRFLRVNE